LNFKAADFVDAQFTKCWFQVQADIAPVAFDSIGAQYLSLF
jgi:hypothetical protein